MIQSSSVLLSKHRYSELLISCAAMPPKFVSSIVFISGAELELTLGADVADVVHFRDVADNVWESYLRDNGVPWFQLFSQFYGLESSGNLHLT
jgi:hypothetical protein